MNILNTKDHGTITQAKSWIGGSTSGSSHILQYSLFWRQTYSFVLKKAFTLSLFYWRPFYCDQTNTILLILQWIYSILKTMGQLHRLNHELEDQQVAPPIFSNILYSGAKHIPLFSKRPLHSHCSIGALFIVTRLTQYF